MSREMVKVCVNIKWRTNAALLIDEGDDQPEKWIPLSHVDEYESDIPTMEELRQGVQHAKTISISEWIATQKGLV